MLAKNTFTPTATHDDFTLKATLTDHAGNIVDEATLTYDCKAINPKLCVAGSKKPLVIVLILISAILAIAVLAGAARNIKVRRKK